MKIKNRPDDWPEDGCLDIYWIMLSMIVAPRERLIEVLPGRVPRKSSPYVDNGAYNPLITFLSLVTTSGGWWWIHLDDTEDAIHTLKTYINKGYSNNKPWEMHSWEGLESKWWDTLRKHTQAVMLIGTAGKTADLPETFDPTEYNEFTPCFFNVDYDSLVPKY